MKQMRVSLFFIAVAVSIVMCSGCGKKQARVVVFHAGSLNLPFKALADEFMKSNPDIVVEQESGGSVMMVRAITDLGRHCDLLAVADYRLLDSMMIPEHADWQIMFARNEMTVAYTGMSRHSDEITAANWYEILLRPDTQYSHSDPNLDPSGYRTLLCWKLASLQSTNFKGDLYEALQKGCDPRNIRPDANQILPLLESVGGVDYLFTYRSVAEQHHLQYVSLPDEVNLGAPELEGLYAKASVTVTDRKGQKRIHTGAPIAYGMTIPKNSRSPEAALRFVKFMLSEKGRNILKKQYQPAVIPPLYRGDNIPAELSGALKPFEKK